MCRGFDSLLRYFFYPGPIFGALFGLSMKSTLLKSLKEFVSRNKLIARGDALVVSVSGGIDSMTMLRLMHSIVADWQLHLTVAHFNHRLRGSESDSDETLVRSACKEYGFECSVSSADTHALVKEQKRSLQEIARDLRYSFLIEVCRTVGAATIATAHNADDNIETLLFNLFRGAGVHGLSGIPVSRDHDGFRLVRPLLFASRNRIHEFAEENKVTFREDSSNLKDDYSRNYIRHHIIPAIREHINGGVSETLGRASALFHELDEYLSSNVAGLSPSVIVSESADEIIINRTRLLELPQLLQESFFISILKKQGVVEAQSALIESMISIAHSETGASIDIHNGHAFTRDRERLVLYLNQTNQSFSHIIMPEKSFDFGAFNFTSSLV